jgi:predicted alpha/beta superfamily hydrolase
MYRIYFLLGLLLPVASVAQDRLPAVATGRIQRFDSFPSQWVTARNIDVWLPEGYHPSQQYSVLYMHDGQMLYDSTTTWNRKDWGVDETVGRLIREKVIAPCIVVGIWNAGKERHADYFPQKPFEALPKMVQDSLYGAHRPTGQSVFNSSRVHSDAYLRFIVSELKPFIDSTFSTYRDRTHTFIAGSSMGGLISWYALCEYPAIFGGAACLSTHWPGVFAMDNNPIPDAFITYLTQHLPRPRAHRLYFDYGDQTLDAYYPPLQRRVDDVMRSKRYKTALWQTRFFPGQDHSEAAWAGRLGGALQFLMGW